MGYQIYPDTIHIAGKLLFNAVLTFGVFFLEFSNACSHLEFRPQVARIQLSLAPLILNAAQKVRLILNDLDVPLGGDASVIPEQPAFLRQSCANKFETDFFILFLVNPFAWCMCDAALRGCM